MNQTTTTTIDAHRVSDLEALRLQLEEDGRVYYNNPYFKEDRERLLHTLQTNDCREIITAVVDGEDLASAFVAAGHRNHVDTLNAFLNHGMNINVKDQKGWTALIGASYNGQEESIQLCLDHNAKVDVQNRIGDTALMIASRLGNTEIVEVLLDKNANPDIQNESGMTALMWASAWGHKIIIQVLLNHNADIELKSNDGKTALDLAENDEIKEMIRNHVNASYVLK